MTVRKWVHRIAVHVTLPPSPTVPTSRHFIINRYRLITNSQPAPIIQTRKPPCEAHRMAVTLRFITKRQPLAASLHKATFPTTTRRFHSPFAALESSKALKHYPSHHQSNNIHTIYEKQIDHAPEPLRSFGGLARISYVSEPDPSHTPYAVPSGAYPVSTPYINFSPMKFPGAFTSILF
jgi:hypothetical protein